MEEANRDEVLACQIASWYPSFYDDLQATDNALCRSKATIQTIFVPLPENFVQSYLLDNTNNTGGQGFYLPAGAKTSTLLPDNSTMDDTDWSSTSQQEEEEKPESKKATNKQPNELSFPELDRAISQAIEALGGSAMPKLNWSAPKDAVWITGNMTGTSSSSSSSGLQCQTPGDVYLLLKASDFCMYDLQYALQTTTTTTTEDDSKTADSKIKTTLSSSDFTPTLALRKWCTLYPSQEFRCFVRGHELIAVSQRHHSQHYPHLLRDRFLFQSLLIEFFDEIVHPRFAKGTIANYVWDAYIDKNEKVWILDFNVWSPRTDALLFEWDELQGLDIDAPPTIRVVETGKQVRADPLASYRAPIDTVHVASMTSSSLPESGGEKNNKFEEFMKMCVRPSELSDDSSDDD